MVLRSLWFRGIVLLALVALASSPASARSHPVLDQKMRVVRRVTGKNLVSAVGELTGGMPVPFHLEPFAGDWPDTPISAPGFRIEPGIYPIRTILNRLGAASPRLSWRVTRTCVNIQFKRKAGDPDPLARRTKRSYRFNSQLWGVLNRLNTADPTLAFSAIGGMMGERDPTQSHITLAVPRGITIREVLNRCAAQAKATWRLWGYRPQSASPGGRGRKPAAPLRWSATIILHPFEARYGRELLTLAVNGKRLPLEKAVPILRSRLRSPDPAVRARTILHLSLGPEEMDGTPLIEELIRLFESTPAPLPEEGVALTAAEKRDLQIKDGVLDALRSSEDPRAKALIRRARSDPSFRGRSPGP